MKRNTFEGGIDGVALTTANSVTNPPAASGDAFTFAGKGVGSGSITWSNEHPTKGQLSAKIVAPVAGDSAFVQFTPGDTRSLAVQADGFKLTGLPTGLDVTLIQLRGATDGIQGTVILEQSGRIQCQNDKGQTLTTMRTTINQLMPTDLQTMTIDAWIRPGTATSAPFDGKFHVKITLPNAVYELIDDACDLGSNPVNQVSFGKPNGNGVLPAMYMDNVAYQENATDYIAIGAVPQLEIDVSATPIEGSAPLSVAFEVTAIRGGNGNTPSFKFNFGDNTPEVNQTSLTLTHIYQTVGTYGYSVVPSQAA